MTHTNSVGVGRVQSMHTPVGTSLFPALSMSFDTRGKVFLMNLFNILLEFLLFTPSREEQHFQNKRF